MSTSHRQTAVSGLKFPLPAWRYALLFQSWSQFQSWAIIVLGTVLAINGLLALLQSHVVPVEGVLIGCAFGSLMSVIMVLPVEFEFKPSSCNPQATLQNYLEYFGYVRSDDGTNAIVYRQKLPKFLRWEEGKVFITRPDGSIRVKGPLMILRKLQRALVASQNT